MSIWLLLLLAVGRLYHPLTIDQFATSHHTHVEVRGRVTYLRHEDDGDWHVTISDAHQPAHWVVCEIVPELPLDQPHIGQTIVVRGIRRFDDEHGHGWWEVHPVEQWKAVP